MSFKKSYEEAKAKHHPMSRSKGMKRGRKPLRSKPDPKLAAWGHAVKKRDGECQAREFSGRGAYEFTMIKCSGPLDAHHIAPRSRRPDLKCELSNGIALCRRHHTWVGDNPIKAEKIGLNSFETYEMAMRTAGRD